MIHLREELSDKTVFAFIKCFWFPSILYLTFISIILVVAKNQYILKNLAVLDFFHFNHVASLTRCQLMFFYKAVLVADCWVHLPTLVVFGLIRGLLRSGIRSRFATSTRYIQKSTKQALKKFDFLFLCNQRMISFIFSLVSYDFVWAQVFGDKHLRLCGKNWKGLVDTWSMIICC